MKQWKTKDTESDNEPRYYLTEKAIRQLEMSRLLDQLGRDW